MAVFSFLNFRGRRYNRILSAALTLLRKIRHEDLKPQELPWLRNDGKFNYSFWKKNEPTNYWFRREEICAALQSVGYDIIEIFPKEDKGMLYIACRK